MIIQNMKTMQKTLLLVVFLWMISFSAAQCQLLFRTVNSEVVFFSETPIENISAENTKTNSLIDPQKNEIAVVIPMKRFVFPNKRMEEHFQENYLETDRFPFATFKGKINENIDWDKKGRVKISATGSLTIHGVTRNETIVGEISINPNERFVLDTELEITLAHYHISIPTLIWTKIAESIKVRAIFTYLPETKVPSIVTQK
jgi:hypothetical protein